MNVKRMGHGVHKVDGMLLETRLFPELKPESNTEYKLQVHDKLRQYADAHLPKGNGAISGLNSIDAAHVGAAGVNPNAIKEEHGLNNGPNDKISR